MRWWWEGIERSTREIGREEESYGRERVVEGGNGVEVQEGEEGRGWKEVVEVGKGGRRWKETVK